MRYAPGSIYQRGGVQNLDSNTSRLRFVTVGDYEDWIARLGKIDVLVGTQMIAKGLDFPNVTLVGVINADTALHLPDFRASERTFHLVTQVAGRTGRGAGHDGIPQFGEPFAAGRCQGDHRAAESLLSGSAAVVSIRKG